MAVGSAVSCSFVTPDNTELFALCHPKDANGHELEGPASVMPPPADPVGDLLQAIGLPVHASGWMSAVLGLSRASTGNPAGALLAGASATALAIAGAVIGRARLPSEPPEGINPDGTRGTPQRIERGRTDETSALDVPRAQAGARSKEAAPVAASPALAELLKPRRDAAERARMDIEKQMAEPVSSEDKAALHDALVQQQIENVPMREALDLAARPKAQLNAQQVETLERVVRQEIASLDEAIAATLETSDDVTRLQATRDGLKNDLDNLPAWPLLADHLRQHAGILTRFIAGRPLDAGTPLRRELAVLERRIALAEKARTKLQPLECRDLLLAMQNMLAEQTRAINRLSQPDAILRERGDQLSQKERQALQSQQNENAWSLQVAKEKFDAIRAEKNKLNRLHSSISIQPRSAAPAARQPAQVAGAAPATASLAPPAAEPASQPWKPVVPLDATVRARKLHRALHDEVKQLFTQLPPTQPDEGFQTSLSFLQDRFKAFDKRLNRYIGDPVKKVSEKAQEVRLALRAASQKIADIARRMDQLAVPPNPASLRYFERAKAEVFEENRVALMLAVLREMPYAPRRNADSAIESLAPSLVTTHRRVSELAERYSHGRSL